MTEIDHDVVIVGYGPVGQTLAALLAEQGHDVCVVERYGQLYGLPRAIRFDGEVMRIFQRLGIVEEIAEEIVPGNHYKWFGADGELIVDIDNSAPHESGWSRSYGFYQPAVEAALDRRARALARLETGWAAEDVVQHADHVEVALRRGEEPDAGRWLPTDETRVLRARYVVGADGANSRIRETCRIPWSDLGFTERWAVVDVRPNDMREFDHLPVAAQYCDPRRPSVVVKNGAHHRRWEFMLHADEPSEDFEDEAGIWRLLEPHITPDRGRIIRHAVYEFRSRLAGTMRDGRVLLAGDAAHLMPPFMGEGMCSGMRDANNLAWRLDLILRGVVSDDILATYTRERREQNEVTIGISVEMGRVSCTVDPQAAAARDAAFRAGDVPPPPDLPGIGPGITRGGGDAVAGQRAVQGVVAAGDRVGRFDDVVGRGFVLLCARGNPRALLDDERLTFLERIGTQVATLDPEVPGALRDVDGALTSWLGDLGLEAVISRPDYYAFGGVARSEDIVRLVDDLREALGIPTLHAHVSTSA
ncbi:MAG TPA: bifunctional 3-(3-hydroxy-phenyl)propionate/3-hydroxycinnamic acid hydroxylase [Baekduia sp.]|nr:bifunctional 3-(3-hydroxy-phenyl)propionate/3-hydroxycinnamic acid hydroxylase [Baekduia sp.]